MEGYLGCGLGECTHQHEVFVTVFHGDVIGVHGLVHLGVDPTALFVLAWGVPLEAIEDGGNIPLRLPVINGCAGHGLECHKAQTESCDGRRSDQQREGLRVEDTGLNELVNVIAESLDLLRRETSPLTPPHASDYREHVASGTICRDQ